MGFRKRDEEAQRRRNIRANEITMEYAKKKGITPTVLMSSEIHKIGMPIAFNCSTCMKEGIAAEDSLLGIAHHTNPMNDEGWFQNPILDVQCRRGHVGHIRLNTILHTERYPVHIKFLNGGIAWLEGGIAIGNIESLREQGHWPYSDDNTTMGVSN